MKSIRIILRDGLVIFAVLLISPLWIPTRITFWMGMRDGFFPTSSEILSLCPGLVGVFLRRGYYLMCLESFGTDCYIGFGTCLAHPQMSIGKGVYIGGFCTLGMCKIGDNTLIGSNVDILSGRYQHGIHETDSLINEQEGMFKPVSIGQNTWIGNSAVIMADIGEQSVIGAGSVVVKTIPDRSVAVGNPAVVKKQRA